MAVSEATSAGLTSQIVNPIISATVDTFGMMMECKVNRTGLSLLQPGTRFYEITAMIGLSGNSTGTFCLSFPASTAFEIVHRMLEINVDTVTPLIFDTVSELSNGIAENAKDKLATLDLEMGLPNVVHGENQAIEFPPQSRPMVSMFDSEVGSFMLAFGLVNHSDA